jgi:histidyl-tRNA synthetase
MPAPLIEARVLKGFRDSLPTDEMRRLSCFREVEEVFRSRGFVPIDTPAMEYAEVLLGKGGGETEKQIYRFQDHGKRDVALRFDLTVPFARFMAEHHGELGLPFRRYHIAKVWRGENTQRGRYREFFQCDCDIVGTDSPAADFEVLETAAEALDRLGLKDFSIRVSHRAAFNHFLERIGAAGASAEILRAADKLAKLGHEETEALIAAAAGPQGARSIMDFISISGDFEAGLERMRSILGGPEPGIERLERVWAYACETGLARRLVLDASITRGLDYYTGIVFETFLGSCPGMGSVCSGGRYDDLASLYSKERMPGVGASIGMDRLLAALDESGADQAPASAADALIVCMEEEFLGRAFTLAGRLRAKGLSIEVFTERKKLPQAFAYAEKRGIPKVVIIGPDEAASGYFSIRDLGSRQNASLPGEAELAAALGAR